MGNQFFLSSEFENLIDLSALSISVFLIPLVWAGARRAGPGVARIAYVGFFAAANLVLGLQAFRSGYSLASDLPFSSGYFLPLVAAAGTLAVGALAALLWSRSGRSGAGLFLAMSVLTAGFECAWIYQSLASEMPLLYRGMYALGGSVAYWLSPLRLAVLAAALYGFALSGKQKAPGRLIVAALLLAAREIVFFMLVRSGSAVQLAWASCLSEGALAVAAMLAAAAFYDFEEVASRSLAFRLFVLSFVVMATVSLTLSFNYILRVRLLDEALVRYQGEGRKIGADITADLDHLSDSLGRLAEPSVYRFFSTRFHASSSVVSDLGLDLVRGYIPREFQTVSFTDKADFLLFTYARVAEDAAAAPPLTPVQMQALSQSPGRVFVYRMNEEARGNLLYENEGRPAIREEAVANDPIVLFAAAVKDRAGGIQGFVKAVMKVRTLLELTAGYGNTSGWDFIASGDGVLLAHSRLGYTGFRIESQSKAWSEAIHGKRWYQLDLPGGRLYLAFYQMEDTGWVIARAVSTPTIIESTRKLRGATLLMLIITVLVAAVTAVVVSTILTRQKVAIERMGFEVERKRVLEDRNRALDLKNRELADERRRIEAILVSIGEGVAVLDPDGRVIFMNGAARRILRVSQGQKVEDMSALSLGLADLPAEIERARAEQGPTYSFQGRTGDTDIRVTISRVQADDGSPGPVVLAIQDITELMKVDRLKTEIISIVSHSLRTPLTSIKSYTEILQSKAGKIEREKELEFLGVIDRSADRLSRIVNNLLDLSKVASGKMHYRFEPTDIAELVSEAMELVSGSAAAKKIRLEIHGGGRLPEIQLDRLKFKQVLDNLLGNSLKFTPAGGRIGVTTEALSGRDLLMRTGRPSVRSNLNYVLIRVKDSGGGIRKQNLERVFDKFFQDDYVRQSSEGGTGLGLAISKEYVIAHGGLIWAEAPESGGAELCVALPAGAAENESAA